MGFFDNKQQPKKEEISGEQNAPVTANEDNGVGNDKKEEISEDPNASVTANKDIGVGNDKKEKNSTKPKDINVRVTGDAPIVLLFGAQSTGKTMTLVRLGRYLRTQGYELSVDDLFCKKEVWEYKENTEKFNSMLATDVALEGTKRNDFLFVNVTKKGNVVCHILEAAGEDYFPLSNDGHRDCSKEFPGYMTTVFNTNNKKLWIFVIDATWSDYQIGEDYVNRIRSVVGSKYCNKKKDKFLLLYNKADTRNYITGSDIRNEQAEQVCYKQYEKLKEIFENPTKSIFGSKYLHKFLAFSTGTYIDEDDDDKKFVPSRDFVPEALWKLIKGQLHI